MKSRLPALASALLALAASVALPAATPAPPPAATTPATATPAALRYPLQHGFHLVRSFPAVSGLTGWVLKDPDGEYRLVYSTADGQTLLSGSLFTAGGTDLTDTYTAQFVPQPDLNGLWARLETATSIATGTTVAPKSVIYAIMDPNCIYCHLLWKALKPYQAAGLEVRWVPVGFLHEDSAAKAAAILQGGAAAFEQSQETFNEKTESGGIAGVAPDAATQAKLAVNLQLMRDAQIQGTPGVFFKDSAGKVQRLDGMPPMADLARVTGLPAQAETDPELKQFE